MATKGRGLVRNGILWYLFLPKGFVSLSILEGSVSVFLTCKICSIEIFYPR